MITIDAAIEHLQRIKEELRTRPVPAFPKGKEGNVVVVLSLTGSGIETQAIDEIVLVKDTEGALVEVRVRLPFDI